MDPVTIALITLSVGGKLISGISANESSKLQAFDIGTEKKRSNIEAIQRHNDRLELYRNNTKVNIAAFASTGREISGATVDAFFARQKEIAGQDIKRSDVMALLQSQKLDSQARTVRGEGRARLQSSLIESTTAGLSAYKKAGDTATPTTSRIGGSGR